MSKKVVHLELLSKQLKKLREKGLSTSLGFDLKEKDVNAKAVAELADVNREQIELYCKLLEELSREVESPKPGWRRYINNLEREAAVLLEQIDFSSRLLKRAVMILREKKAKGGKQ